MLVFLLSRILFYLQERNMSKVFADAKSALAGLLKDDMTLPPVVSVCVVFPKT